jgi:hypothetical protein
MSRRRLVRRKLPHYGSKLRGYGKESMPLVICQMAVF